MTATKSSRKTNLVTGSYITYRIKRSWAVMLLCFIVMFFCTVVPFLVNVDYLTHYVEENDASRAVERITSYFTDNAAWCIIISGIFAVVCGCSSLSYLHNKVSAGFFHALPEKRSGHFIASLTAAFADFALPLIANILLLLLSAAANALLYRFVFVLILKTTILCLFTFLVILSVCYLAGMLTGTGAIHVIFTFYLLLILPVIVYAFAFWVCENTTYLRLDAFSYVEYTGIFLSPLIRLGHVTVMSFNEVYAPAVLALVIDLILMPFSFIGAYFLYTKRPIEGTGTPIIYKKLSEAVKYTVMFPMAFLGAVFFDSVGNGDVWLIFGFFAGIILTFMLMNTVLNRTTKAMFSGLKGLGVFTVVTIVLFVTACTGIFGSVDYIVPAAKEISIHLDGQEYVIKDKAIITEIRREMKEFNKELKNDPSSVIYTVTYSENGAAYEKYEEKAEYYVYETGSGKDLAKSVRTASFTVDYKDAFGAVTSYRYNNVHMTAVSEIKAILVRFAALSTGSEIAPDDPNFYSNLSLNFYISKDDIVDAINSDTYLKEKLDFIVNLPEVVDYEYDYCIISAEYTFNQNRRTDSERKLTAQKYSEFTDAVTESALSTEPRQSIGNFRIHSNDGESYYNTSHSLCYEDLALLERITGEDGIFKCEYINVSIGNEFAQLREDLDISEFSSIMQLLFDYYSADYVNNFVEDVSYLLIFDVQSKDTVRVTDKALIKEYIGLAAQISGTASLAPFTPTDINYVMYVGMEQENDSYITYLLEK